MNYLTNYDVIILAETFIDEKQKDKANELLPTSHNWTWLLATRENRKGRAMGGLLMGVRKSIKEGKEWINRDQQIIAKEIEIHGNKHIVIALYNRSGLNILKNQLQEYIEKQPNRRDDRGPECQNRNAGKSLRSS